MSAYSFVFVSFTFLFLLLSRANANPQIKPYFAIKCLGQSNYCTKYYATYSGNRCKRQTRARDQPEACIRYACDWCATNQKSFNMYPCQNPNVQAVCYDYNKNKNNNNNNNNHNTPNGKCTWTGTKNNVVIDLGKVPLTGGWQTVFRYNLKGIVFRSSKPRGILPRGQFGKMCFDIKAAVTGNYYFTAISYAPHNTEHNDVWVTSSLGFQIWKRGISGGYCQPGKWLKAYQNNGKKGISEHFKTVDHNGHRMIIPNVQAYKKFNVCISGRSSNYEMYRIILYKCDGMYCRGGIMKGDMLFNLKPSSCV